MTFGRLTIAIANLFEIFMAFTKAAAR